MAYFKHRKTKYIININPFCLQWGTASVTKRQYIPLSMRGRTESRSTSGFRIGGISNVSLRG